MVNSRSAHNDTMELDVAITPSSVLLKDTADTEKMDVNNTVAQSLTPLQESRTDSMTRNEV